MLAKHDILPMDLVAIDTCKGKRLYSFLAVAWGMISDVDIESEKFRSMGESRFTLMAAVKILGRSANSPRETCKKGERKHECLPSQINGCKYFFVIFYQNHYNLLVNTNKSSEIFYEKLLICILYIINYIF